MIIICAWQSHNPRYLLPLIPVGFIFFASAGQWLPGPESTLAPAPGAARRRRIIVIAVQAAAIAFNLVILGLDLNIIRYSPVTPTGGGEYASLSGGDRQLLELTGEIKWGYWYQYPDWLGRAGDSELAYRYHSLIAASVWMGRSLPGTALVMARKPRLSCWYSGRKTIQYPPTPQPEAFARFLRRRGVTHLLVDKTSPEVWMAIQGFMQERPGMLVPVFSIGGAYVLEVQKDEG
jgi:hypothetical protein